MKKIILFLSVVLFLSACRQGGDSVVKIQTSEGMIRMKLYMETSLHRDNFLKLVKEGYYNGMLFHRAIREFMIQTGDPDSKKARPGMRLGANGIGYTLKPEIMPRYYHKRGAVAAARENDNVNPLRESDGSHFYIVQGKVFSATEIDTVVQIINNKRFTALFQKLQRQREGEILKLQAVQDTGGLMRINDELSVETRNQFEGIKLTLSDEQRKAYTTIGGAPNLDGEYTVFGEVMEGMDVVDKIARLETDDNFRPLQDVVIYKIEIEK